MSRYTTKIKYLRALHRTLHVSSGTSAYVADTYALASGPAETAILGQVSANSTSPALLSSTRAMSASPSPLLSPIPWMTASDASLDGDSMHLDSAAHSSSSPHLAPVNGHDASLAEGGSPQLPTASPTGGRVDEVGLAVEDRSKASLSNAHSSLSSTLSRQA